MTDMGYMALRGIWMTQGTHREGHGTEGGMVDRGNYGSWRRAV